jgi:hypothetical protein
VVTSVAPAAAAACALTVSVDVHVPPGARLLQLVAESVDGNTKLALVPVSVKESANVELLHTEVSLLVTVAV